MMFHVQLDVVHSLRHPRVQIEYHAYMRLLCWNERLLGSIPSPCSSTSWYRVHRADHCESMLVVQTQEPSLLR